jgi:galactokinase
LVDTAGIEDFMAVVGAGYSSETGLKADFYISEIGEGVSKIN